ncbi:hypothetical protein GCM10009740_14970 [Terrabacter terrae]|uniref:Uncharacterized protein n=1 Tax=Terrabacter terrae TaxID=318434 RepID=A0ABN2TZR9_9MICO
MDELRSSAGHEAGDEPTERVGDEVEGATVLGGEGGRDGLDVVRQLGQGVAAGPRARAVAAQVDGDDEPVARELLRDLRPVGRGVARRVDEERGRPRTGAAPVL